MADTDTEFNDAVEFAKKEGYAVTGIGIAYVEWRLTDRDRALLALLRKDLTNHRMIRIPIPSRIT